MYRRQNGKGTKQKKLRLRYKMKTKKTRESNEVLDEVMKRNYRIIAVKLV